MECEDREGRTKKYKGQLARNFLHIFRRKAKEEGVPEPEVVQVGLTYIKMVLPVENITAEFENSIKEKISHSILKAQIREATESDLEKIKNIHNRAWMTGETPYTPISLEGIKDVFEIPTVKIFVAKVYGEDSGFIITDLVGKNKECGEIVGLGILPRFQRRYLGTMLGLHSWEYFKKKNVKRLICEVYIENHASYKLIKGLGFEEVERKTYGIEEFESGDKS